MEYLRLPPPKLKGKLSLQECILKRRSVRSFSDKNLTLQEISQILWAAGGITDEGGRYRAAPSAGATFPIDIYLVSPEGFFKLDIANWRLEKKIDGDIREKLAAACWNQNFIADAGISVVIVAIYERTTSFYGKRGVRYVDMEAGHIAQNIHLQAVEMGMGSVPIGAFNDSAVSRLLRLSKKEVPIYIISVGYPK